MQLYLSAIMLAFALSAMGMGIFLSIRIFNIPDITTDGSYTLGGVVTVLSLLSGLSPIISMLLAIMAGAIGGTCTGLITTKLKVNPLLAGILVTTALYSVNLTLMGRPNIPLININTVFSSMLFMPNTNYGTFLLLAIISFLLIGILTWVLKTDFGIAMRATGGSETMAKAMGVNTDRMKVMGLAIANGCTALSGSLVSQYQGYTDINMGIGIVILGLGAVMIGESLISVIKIKNIFLQIISVVVGSIIFRLILAYTLSLGLNPNLLKFATAAFVLISISLPQLINKNLKQTHKL